MKEYDMEYYRNFHGISYNPIRVLKRYFGESLLKVFKILIVPCGDGKYIRNMRKKGLEVYGLDISHALKLYPSGYTVLGDIRHLPFQDNTFDVVISRYLLEHFKYVEIVEALEELSRVADQFLYIGVTTTDVKPERFNADPTHKMALTWEEWTDLLIGLLKLEDFKKIRQIKSKEEWLFRHKRFICCA